MQSFDDLQLAFSPESLRLLNACIALIMLGVALDLKKENFMMLLKTPKPILVVMASQLLLLPALTALLILVFHVPLYLGLGMILVASCPGGNVSNFFTSLAGGHLELSISATTLSSLLSALLTPLNFALYAGLLYSGSVEAQFEVNLWDMFMTIFLIIVLPSILGYQLSRRFPSMVSKLKKPLRWFSFLFLIGFIGVALGKNFDHFLNYLDRVFLLVLFQNALAFFSGFTLAYLFKLSIPQRITAAMETGIQNSGLGLIIIFTFFDGNGPMSFIAAWWGIWHIVAGGVVALASQRIVKT